MVGCCNAVLFSGSEHCCGRAHVLKLEVGSLSCQQDKTMPDTTQGMFLWVRFCTHMPLRPSKQTCVQFVVRAEELRWGCARLWRLSSVQAVPVPGTRDTSNSHRILLVTFCALQSSPAYCVPKSRSLPTECIADTIFAHISAVPPLLVNQAL